MMKKILLACVAMAALTTAAPAQGVPTLKDFLANCFRDGTACRVKLKDYVNASTTQNIICLPKDVSASEAAGETLRWLRSDTAHGPELNDQPFDDGLYAATTKLYPCAPPAPPPAPPPQQPTTQPQP